MGKRDRKSIASCFPVFSTKGITISVYSLCQHSELLCGTNLHERSLLNHAIARPLLSKFSCKQPRSFIDVASAKKLVEAVLTRLSTTSTTFFESRHPGMRS